jgi:spore maturation protein CgeB
MNRLNISFFGSSLVSAYRNGTVAYYRGLIRALADHGHRVTFYEPNTEERRRHRDIRDPDWARVVAYSATDESALEALEKAEESDLIIKCSGVGVSDELLEAAALELKKPETLVAYLDMNPPPTLDRIWIDPEDSFRALIPEYDFILTRCGGAIVEDYLTAGAADCIPIYNALDSHTHFPMQPEKRFEGELGFLGNRTAELAGRVEEFFFKPAALMPKRKFLLGGSGWQDRPKPANVEYAGNIDAQDHNAFNCTPGAVLNINGSDTGRSGFSPPVDLFEATGAGACVITDKWDGIEMFLEPDREVLVASSGDEVVEQLRRLTPERAREIGRAAWSRVLAEHTYSHRASQLERVLESKTGRIVA